jgi:hypothetical protein
VFLCEAHACRFESSKSRCPSGWLLLESERGGDFYELGAV